MFKLIRKYQEGGPSRAERRAERRADGTFDLNLQMGGQAMSAVGNVLGAALGNPDYSGLYGDMTSKMDAGYEATQQALSNAGPWGAMASGIMSINKGLGGAFGETDKTNKIDAAMDSAFTPFFVKWINSATARTLKSGLSAQQDEKVKTYLGDAFGNYDSLVGSKVGGFAKRYYNKFLNKLNMMSRTLGRLADSAEVGSVRSSDMVSINNQSYAQMIEGQNDNPIERGLKGMKISKLGRYRNIVNKANNLNLKDLEKSEELPIEKMEETPQAFKKGGKTSNKRDMLELILIAFKENPRFVQRFFESPKAIEFTDNNGNISRGSHNLNYASTGDSDAVFPSIQEDENGNLIYIQDPKEAYIKAKNNNDVLYLNPGEGEIFTSNYKKSAFLKPFMDKWNSLYSDYNIPIKDAIENPKYFKQGGQMNVIPEGALHARKNNMELAKEGEITHKGIPVVDKEGGQVAEVEKEEITFTKPVTEKLEDWYKKFYAEDISDKEKDELAIKCGKFLAKEILFNTDDRVGLIDKIKELEGLQ